MSSGPGAREPFEQRVDAGVRALTVLAEAGTHGKFVSAVAALHQMYVRGYGMRAQHGVQRKLRARSASRRDEPGSCPAVRVFTSRGCMAAALRLRACAAGLSCGQGRGCLQTSVWSRVRRCRKHGGTWSTC